jgi:hypothetical protein
LGSFFPGVSIALLFLTLAGCGPSGDSALIVATTWSLTERTQFEAAYREQSDDRRPIVWVHMGPGERLESAVDRRGGVDIVLGGPASAIDRLEASGRLAGTKPIGRGLGSPPVEPRVTHILLGDPRLDPVSFALAKSKLDAQGWPKGYEALVRAAARRGTIVGGQFESSLSVACSECVALVRGGPNPARATRFLQILEARGLTTTPSSHQSEEAAADDLLADLLGSALVDSRDELCEAEVALVRFGHPTKAEEAIGQRPPWPPASVEKLLADPNGRSMFETLLEQVAPDPDSRAWLVESWSKPKRPIDGELLAEIAGADNGRLVLEPRFRAWLRGEWTAWTRQLYRRVARVAGGYIPS